MTLPIPFLALAKQLQGNHRESCIGLCPLVFNAFQPQIVQNCTLVTLHWSAIFDIYTFMMDLDKKHCCHSTMTITMQGGRDWPGENCDGKTYLKGKICPTKLHGFCPTPFGYRSTVGLRLGTVFFHGLRLTTLLPPLLTLPPTLPLCLTLISAYHIMDIFVTEIT